MYKRQVCDQPDMYYFLYGEGWAHTQAEMLERGLTLRQYEEFARLQNGVPVSYTHLDVYKRQSIHYNNYISVYLPAILRCFRIAGFLFSKEG